MRHSILATFCLVLGTMATAAGEEGALVLSGGGDNSGLWPILFDRMEGKQGAIVVIAPASKPGEQLRDLEELRELKPGKVKLLDTGDASLTPESIAATLGEAQMVWIGGESRLPAGPESSEAIRRGAALVMERGGIVGGSSSGASILASGLTGKKKPAASDPAASADPAGFSLMKDAAVLTDANLRAETGEFRRVLEAEHAFLCISIDQATALLVRGGEAEVVGAGFIRFGSMDGGALQTCELSSGEHFDLGSRKAGGRPAKGTGAVRVAIYSGAGTRPQNEAVIRECLADEKGRFAMTAVGPDEIRKGRLGDFDVLIQSGGRASEQADALGEEGREKIREFVRRGGGYAGFNAGTYLAAADRPYYLRLLNAKVIDREHWSRGKGSVQIRFTEEGREILDRRFHTTQIQFNNCPLLVRDSQADLPSYDELAVYETEIFGSAAPQGVMKGTSAMECAPYGKGRVFCSGPHPTANNPEWRGFLQRAVLWTAGRDLSPDP